MIGWVNGYTVGGPICPLPRRTPPDLEGIELAWVGEREELWAGRSACCHEGRLPIWRVLHLTGWVNGCTLRRRCPVDVVVLLALECPDTGGSRCTGRLRWALPDFEHWTKKKRMRVRSGCVWLFGLLCCSGYLWNSRGIGIGKKDINGWIVVGIPGSGIWNVFRHLGGLGLG